MSLRELAMNTGAVCARYGFFRQNITRFYGLRIVKYNWKGKDKFHVVQPNHDLAVEISFAWIDQQRGCTHYLHRA